MKKKNRPVAQPPAKPTSAVKPSSGAAVEAPNKADEVKIGTNSAKDKFVSTADEILRAKVVGEDIDNLERMMRSLNNNADEEAENKKGAGTSEASNTPPRTTAPKRAQPRKGPRRFTLLDKPTLKEQVGELMKPFRAAALKGTMKREAIAPLEGFFTEQLKDAEYQYNVARTIQEEGEVALFHNVNLAIRRYATEIASAQLASFQSVTKGSASMTEEFEMYDEMENTRLREEASLKKEFEEAYLEVNTKAREAMERYYETSLLFSFNETLDGKTKVDSRALAGRLQSLLEEYENRCSRYKAFLNKILGPFVSDESKTREARDGFAADVVSNYFELHHEKLGVQNAGLHKMFGTASECQEFTKRMNPGEGPNAAQFYYGVTEEQAALYPETFFEDSDSFYESDVVGNGKKKPSPPEFLQAPPLPSGPPGAPIKKGSSKAMPTVEERISALRAAQEENRRNSAPPPGYNNVPPTNLTLEGARRVRTRSSVPPSYAYASSSTTSSTPAIPVIPAIPGNGRGSTLVRERGGVSSSGGSSTNVSPYYSSSSIAFPSNPNSSVVQTSTSSSSSSTSSEDGVRKRVRHRRSIYDGEDDKDNDKKEGGEEEEGGGSSSKKVKWSAPETLDDLFKGAPPQFLDKLFPAPQERCLKGLKAVVDSTHVMAIDDEDPKAFKENVADKDEDFISRVWRRLSQNANFEGLYAFVAWATILGGMLMGSAYVESTLGPNRFVDARLKDAETRALMDKLMKQQLAQISDSQKLEQFKARFEAERSVVEQAQVMDHVFSISVVEYTKRNLARFKDRKGMMSFMNDLSNAAKKDPDANKVYKLMEKEMDAIKMAVVMQEPEIKQYEFTDQIRLDEEFFGMDEEKYQKYLASVNDQILHPGANKLTEIRDNKFFMILRSVLSDTKKSIEKMSFGVSGDEGGESVYSESYVTESDHLAGVVDSLSPGIIFRPKEKNYQSEEIKRIFSELSDTFEHVSKPESADAIEIFKMRQESITRDIIGMTMYFKDQYNFDRNHPVFDNFKKALRILWSSVTNFENDGNVALYESQLVETDGRSAQFGDIMFDYLWDSTENGFASDSNAYKNSMMAAASKIRTMMDTRGLGDVVSPLMTDVDLARLNERLAKGGAAAASSSSSTSVGGQSYVMSGGGGGSGSGSGSSSVGSMMAPFATNEIRKRYDRAAQVLPGQMSIGRGFESVTMAAWLTESGQDFSAEDMQFGLRSFFKNWFGAVRQELWGWTDELDWQGDPTQAFLLVIKKMAVATAATVYTASFPVASNCLITINMIANLYMLWSYQRTVNDTQRQATASNVQTMASEAQAGTSYQLNALISSISRNRWLQARSFTSTAFNVFGTVMEALNNPLSNIILSAPVLAIANLLPTMGLVAGQGVTTYLFSGGTTGLISDMARSAIVSPLAYRIKHIPMLIFRYAVNKSFPTLLTMLLYHLGKEEQVGWLKLNPRRRQQNEKTSALSNMLGHLPFRAHVVMVTFGMIWSSVVSPVLCDSIGSKYARVWKNAPRGESLFGGSGNYTDMQRDVLMAELAACFHHSEFETVEAYFKTLYPGLDYEAYISNFLLDAPMDRKLNAAQMQRSAKLYNWPFVPKTERELAYGIYNLPRNDGPVFRHTQKGL